MRHGLHMRAPDPVNERRVGAAAQVDRQHVPVWHLRPSRSGKLGTKSQHALTLESIFDNQISGVKVQGCLLEQSACQMRLGQRLQHVPCV